MLVIVLAMMFCACEKNETGMPYGVYKSDVGTIRHEDNKVYFEDMDEEFLLELKSSAMAALKYFESRDEGEPISDEELKNLKEEYRKGFDASLYVNKEFSYEYEKYEGEYCVNFALNDGEDTVFSFDYYMEQQYISFGDKEFRVE